jgi:hypothetical protein
MRRHMLCHAFHQTRSPSTFAYSQLTLVSGSELSRLSSGHGAGRWIPRSERIWLGITPGGSDNRSRPPSVRTMRLTQTSCRFFSEIRDDRLGEPSQSERSSAGEREARGIRCPTTTPRGCSGRGRRLGIPYLLTPQAQDVTPLIKQTRRHPLPKLTVGVVGGSVAEAKGSAGPRKENSPRA